MADKEDITRNTPVDNTVRTPCVGASVGSIEREHAPVLPCETCRERRRVALQDIRTQLVKQAEEVQLANGAVNVCVQALLQQNADLDADIAHVLQRAVGDKLFDTAERLELVALGIEYGDELPQGQGSVKTAR